MKREILNAHVRPNKSETVRFKDCGNIKEIMYSRRKNHNIIIRKLDADRYVNLLTGEVKEFTKGETRADDYNSVRSTLARLRDYINTNVTDPTNCRWLTLTYRENMTDTKRLYKDYEKFIKRLRYRIQQPFEYIVAMEPQGRGAWHAHLILIFKDNAPYIKNDIIAEIWGHGFTKTKALKTVDNVGAYLTAYMADMELQDAIEKIPERVTQGLKVETKVVDGKTKRFAKGARMYMYPVGFNIYRCSRGIVKPEVLHIPEEMAAEKVNGATLTFEQTIELQDDVTEFKNIINYRYYNTKRKNIHPTLNNMGGLNTREGMENE